MKKRPVPKDRPPLHDSSSAYRVASHKPALFT